MSAPQYGLLKPKGGGKLEAFRFFASRNIGLAPTWQEFFRAYGCAPDSPWQFQATPLVGVNWTPCEDSKPDLSPGLSITTRLNPTADELRLQVRTEDGVKNVLLSRKRCLHPAWEDKASAAWDLAGGPDHWRHKPPELPSGVKVGKISGFAQNSRYDIAVQVLTFPHSSGPLRLVRLRGSDGPFKICNFESLQHLSPQASDPREKSYQREIMELKAEIAELGDELDAKDKAGSAYWGGKKIGTLKSDHLLNIVAGLERGTWQDGRTARASDETREALKDELEGRDAYEATLTLALEARDAAEENYVRVVDKLAKAGKERDSARAENEAYQRALQGYKGTREPDSPKGLTVKDGVYAGALVLVAVALMVCAIAATAMAMGGL